MEDTLKKRTVSGLAWKILQSVSAQLINFVLQIILARLLLPSDYGVVALAAVFMTVANVFVQTGFTAAVIQKEQLSEEEKSSAFYGGMLLSVLLFVILLFAAPRIAAYYEVPELTGVIRVQAVNLPVLALCSTHLALLTRELLYKKSFLAALVGYVVNGCVGIAMALSGMGVWALVLSALAGNVVNCAVLLFVTRWRPTARPTAKAARGVLSFSANILAANLLNTLYNNMSNLSIGKAYDTTTLGYYSKGFQFPTVIMNNVDGAMNNVLFSTLSRVQSDEARSKHIMRLSQRLSLFVTAPLMAGLFAVAEPLIRLLLTDKWLPAAPFVRVVCVICMFWPLSAKTHAINAKGKSGVTLLFNFVTKLITFGVMLYCKRFPMSVFMLVSMAAEIVNVCIFMPVVAKYLHYTIKEQLFDMLSSMLPAVLMGALVYALAMRLTTPLVPTLLILIGSGAAIYIGLALLTHNDSLYYILRMLRARKAANGGRANGEA